MTQYLRATLLQVLTEYFSPQKRQVEHAVRVLQHAERIMDERRDCDSEIVIASAILHDIGIKISEELHGYNNGRTQEEYGPPVAEEILNAIGFPDEKTEIVKNIIANHHSRPRHDYPELFVLKKADAIVNREENTSPAE